MRGRWVLVAAVLWGGVALTAPPSLLWEGKSVWILPATVPVLSSSFGLTGAIVGWEWTAKAVVKEGVWNSLVLGGSGKLGELGGSVSLSFDPQGPAFGGLTLVGEAEFLGVQTGGVVRLEERGFGWGLSLLGPRDARIELVRLRFNLKRFLDEVLEDTFAPSFSSGEVRFRIGLPCCVERVRGWVSFTKEGSSEFGLRFPLPLPREWGVSFSTVLRLEGEEKNAFVVPAMIYEPPACVEAYLGLDWDPATWAIGGIQLYAVGFRCQLGAVRVRGITELRPIGLVRRPYWEAIWVSWEGTGCCGQAKFTASAYFGDGVFLFGVGEVEVGVEVPLAPDVTLGLGAEVPVAGDTRFTLSWRAKL